MFLVEAPRLFQSRTSNDFSAPAVVGYETVFARTDSRFAVRSIERFNETGDLINDFGCKIPITLKRLFHASQQLSLTLDQLVSW